ncbi:MAG: hypothetical protein BWX55_00536 [Deltaproteobacteria bacterium ADurb.Bin022]|jgi:hypothetical protein|nr:MAG: hypothetical protein BWX55_00536 [Deltaproteobacteria bacterium ADurb.Bin022]
MTATDNTRQMKHYRKWAKDKNPFLAPIYLEFAASSEYIYKMINAVKKGKRIEGDLPLPKIKTWLKLYKNPKRIGKELFNLMGQYDENSAKQAEILQFINEGAEFLKKNPEKFKTEYEKLPLEEKQKIYQQSMQMFEELNESSIRDLLEEVNEAKRNTFLNSIKNPELIFFFRVHAPCFMLYGTYPHMLLRNAQSGDDKALDKLIRLDKSIIFEPKISEIIHQAQVLKAQGKMLTIQKAFIGKPKATISLKKVKILLGGLISYFSIKMNQKLSAAEIRNLFDAIAMDNNDDIDHDLEDLVGAVFEKPIQRSRKFWDVILADKK